MKGPGPGTPRHGLLRHVPFLRCPTWAFRGNNNVSTPEVCAFNLLWGVLDAGPDGLISNACYSTHMPVISISSGKCILRSYLCSVNVTMILTQTHISRVQRIHFACYRLPTVVPDSSNDITVLLACKVGAEQKDSADKRRKAGKIVFFSDQATTKTNEHRRSAAPVFFLLVFKVHDTA